MKPLQKVVTAQDVESCLYYVHLDSEEDEKLLRSLFTKPRPDDMPIALNNTSTIVKDETNVTANHRVHRKPLSALSHSIPRENWNALPQTESLLRGHGQDHVAMHAGPNDANSSCLPSATSLHGPRPMPGSSVGVIDQASKSKRIDVFSGKWSERAPSISHGITPQPELPMDLGQDQIRSSSEAYPSLGSCRVGSMTLIRRYGGMQSNVGKVFYEHRDRPVADGRSPLKSSSGADVIEIYTPGYGKFVKSCSPSSVNSHTSDEVYSASDLMLPSQRAFSQHCCFQRQLHTASSRKRPSLQQRSAHSSSTLSVPVSRSGLAMRRNSQQQTMFGLRTDGTSPPSSPESPPTNAKGHTFYSPWNGVCEFTTGIAGRSLKCKHTSESKDSADSLSAALSSLRFHLPSSSALGPPRTPISADTSNVPKRTSIFSRHSKAYSESTVPSMSPYGKKVELEERLDLSLGQERAGGGFSGKQAKLGKLIVEGAGLNMIDLVVAANMALWRKVFENAIYDL